MNTKVLALATTLTLLAGFSASAFSASPRLSSDERIDRTLAAQSLAVAVAPIKSRIDLARYQANHRLDPDNPLNALSPRSQQRFLASLRFGAEGLSSFSYVELESELTPKQAYRVLSLFGAQGFTSKMTGLRALDDSDRLIMKSLSSEIIDDGGTVLLADHWCSSRATCSAQSGSVCIVSSC